MTKKDIAEIKKLFSPKKCSIQRICGCYVDGEKNKKAEFGQAFLSLPEEEMFKYFEILKKNLSGSIGKNLMNLDFPLHSEEAGGTQEFLMRLRDSELKDETLLEEFYDKIIENYEFVGNYLILLIHDVYDVPGKTSDGIDMDDASDEIYDYILACICPVELSKPGLSYNAEENTFQNRVRDWVVGLPYTGFLFPAFNDRSTDIHSALYYSKDGEELRDGFVSELLGCALPLSAGGQKATFQTIVEEVLGEKCDLETVKNIHEKLTEMKEATKEEPEPLVLAKNEVKAILADSGAPNDKLEHFDEQFVETAGETAALLAANVMSTKTFEVKTPDVVIKVKPERTDLVETRQIDGLPCLVIRLDGDVTVNGIAVRPLPAQDEDDDSEKD